MVTPQQIQDMLTLQSAINSDGGRGTMARAKKQAAAINAKYTPEEIAVIQSDPQFIEYVRTHSDQGGGFLGGLFSGISNFANEAGVKEALMLGGLAYGANNLGLFGSPAAGSSALASTVPSTVGSGTWGMGYDMVGNALPAISTGGEALGALGSGISNALPAGGMVGTGGLSAADAAMMGVGGAGSVGAGTLASGGMTLGDLISNPSMDSAGQYITDNAGNLINAGLGMYSSYQAGQAAKDTAAQNAAIQAPWLAAGTGAVNQLSAMTQPGGEFMKDYTVADYEADPYNKWLQEQGNQAINRSAAAKGMLNSGNVLAELAKYGQGMAGQGFADQWNRNQQGQTNKFNRLASLAGTGQTSAQQVSSGNAFSTMGQADATSGMINSLTNLLRSQPQKTASSFW